MNQSQIDDLSTEEYAYFLAYGSLPKHVEVPTVYESIQVTIGNETVNCADERGIPQGIKDVCSNERYDSI